VRKPDQDVLGAALDGLHELAAEQSVEFGHWPAQLWLAHHGAADHLSQDMGRDAAPGCLDFRQFWQRQSPVK
jgi:hypothetical protein